jgi:hypothetical protein
MVTDQFQHPDCSAVNNGYNTGFILPVTRGQDAYSGRCSLGRRDQPWLPGGALRKVREGREVGAAYSITMTHNFKYDLEVVRILQKKGIRYIGRTRAKKADPDLAGAIGERKKRFVEAYAKADLCSGWIEFRGQVTDVKALSIITEIPAIHNQKQG